MKRAYVCTVVLIIALAGCSPALPPTEIPPPEQLSPTNTAEPTPVPPTPTAIPPTPIPGPMLLATPGEPISLAMYSSWSGGDDAFSLNLVLGHFKQDNAYIANVDVAHDQSSAEARLGGNNPPDAFFTDMGHASLNKWIAAGQMEPLDDVYAHFGLSQVIPQGLIEQASSDGHIWMIPVTVGRSNVLWYSQSIFKANGIKPEDVQTFSGWEATAQKLQAAGITPLALGNKDSWVSWQLFENVLAGTLGPEKYSGLWKGTTDWMDEDVTQALLNLKLMLQYSNPDHSRLSWDQAYQLVIQRKAAMYTMGDWMERDFPGSGFYEYGWTTFPGTTEIFMTWPDAFGMPRGTKNPEVARELLAYLASNAAQETLNRNRGSGAICARIDCDYSGLSPYYEESGEDLRTNTIVASVARETFSQTWPAAFTKALVRFLSTQNVEQAQAEFAAACKSAGICQ